MKTIKHNQNLHNEWFFYPILGYNSHKTGWNSKRNTLKKNKISRNETSFCVEYCSPKSLSQYFAAKKNFCNLIYSKVRGDLTNSLKENLQMDKVDNPDLMHRLCVGPCLRHSSSLCPQKIEILMKLSFY